MAVCDGGGHLLGFHRMDGASAVSTTVAQGQAAASAGIGRPSGALAADSPVIQSIIATLGGRMLPAQGAVPMYKNGELGGAISGSGATAQQDEAWAHVGEAALLTTRHAIWRLDSRHMPGVERASGSLGAKLVWTAREASQP